MHIVIRALGHALCIFAVATHAYVWLEGLPERLAPRWSVVATHAYVWLEGYADTSCGYILPVATHAYAWLEGK